MTGNERQIRERTVLLTLATAQFCNIVDFMIMMPLGHQMMRIFSTSAREFSFLVSAYTFSAGVSGFLMVFFADRFDRKRLLSLMFSGFMLGTLACALAPTYVFLLAARLVTGVFGGMIGSTVLAIVSDLVPIQRRGTAMGIINTAFSAASVFGVPFGLFLATTLSWHAPFLFVVAVALPVFYLIRTKVPNMDSHVHHERVKPFHVLKNIWDNSNQVRALLFMCTLMFAHFILIPFLSPSMVANVGFTEGQLTWIYFLGGLVSIVTGPWIGRVADRVGKHRVYWVGGIAALVPCFLITHMGQVGLPVALAVTTFFFVASGGRMIPAMAIVSGTVKPKNRGSFMSLQASLQQISLGLASFLAGLIVVQDPASGALLRYQYVGYISIVMGILTLFLVSRIQVVDKEAEGLVVEI
jgi:predicted MFS family arabinose efflux permease